MFTGIVADRGEVLAVQPGADSARVTVGSALLASLTPGESVAVNGVCLTASTVGDEAFAADVMAETLNRSALGDLAPGQLVNLERPVTPATLLGGHIVQGHVDGVGTIRSRTPGDGWEMVDIEIPKALSRYVVEKGSVALDGVSLTVVVCGDGWLRVSLIPETLQRTTLGIRAIGERVNVEVDVLAKYVESLLNAGAQTSSYGAKE